MAQQLQRTHTLTNWGFDFLGIWFQGTDAGVNLITNTNYGFTIDWGTNQDSERSLALAPPRPFTNDSQSQYLNINIPTSLTVPGIGMSFSMRGVSTHDDWETGTSPSKIPSSSEVVIESTLTNSDAWVLQDDSTYSLIFNIDMETNFARGNGGAIQDAPLKRFSWAADWKGKLGFWLSTSITSSTLYAPTITSWTIPFETGHGVLTEKGRNLIDDKTGLPTYASEMMEDGFHRGRWTTANAWDPDDPRNLRTIKPSKTEGKIVDKVPLTGSGN